MPFQLGDLRADGASRAGTETHCDRHSVFTDWVTLSVTILAHRVLYDSSLCAMATIIESPRGGPEDLSVTGQPTYKCGGPGVWTASAKL